MLKILWKMGEIAHEEQFLPLSTIFYCLMLDFYVKTGIRFSLRDKRLFEITEVEITRVDCKRNVLLYKLGKIWCTHTPLYKITIFYFWKPTFKSQVYSENLYGKRKP